MSEPSQIISSSFLRVVSWFPVYIFPEWFRHRPEWGYLPWLCRSLSLSICLGLRSVENVEITKAFDSLQLQTFPIRVTIKENTLSNKTMWLRIFRCMGKGTIFFGPSIFVAVGLVAPWTFLPIPFHYRPWWIKNSFSNCNCIVEQQMKLKAQVLPLRRILFTVILSEK